MIDSEPRRSTNVGASNSLRVCLCMGILHRTAKQNAELSRRWTGRWLAEPAELHTSARNAVGSARESRGQLRFCQQSWLHVSTARKTASHRRAHMQDRHVQFSFTETRFIAVCQIRIATGSIRKKGPLAASQQSIQLYCMSHDATQ